jgi:phosphatidate cytidylyltransferase
MSRVVTALVLLPPLLAVILFAPSWSFLLVAELAGLLGVRELYGLAKRNGYRAFRSIGYAATLFLVASFYPGAPSVAAIVVAFVLLVGVAAVARGNPTRETLGDVATTILAPLYGGLLIGTLVGVRLAEPAAIGRHWVLFLLAVIMMGDAGAYYLGRAFGRRKLAPSVSPNKTVEGLLGGTLAAVAAALLASRLFLPEVHPLRAGILGLILSLLGVAGDLFESLLKRSAGVKNTSELIPGHGGVLDRLDSLYFSAPVLFAYLQLVAK